MIVLGIDPGLYHLGWGVVSKNTTKLECIASGTFHLPKNSLEIKLEKIYDFLHQTIQRYQPSFLAIETQFFSKNAHSTMTLTMCRAIILLISQQNGIPMMQLSPQTAKKAVTGQGNATKETMKKMVQTLLQLSAEIVSFDEADALGLAICAALRSKSCTTILSV